TPSYNFPFPRCPICRADYPECDRLLFCRQCQQPTEQLPRFQFQTIEADGTTVTTFRAPLVTSFDPAWRSPDCCGRRVHAACEPLPHGRCRFCSCDFCLFWHRSCPSSCVPRLCGDYPSSATTPLCTHPPLRFWNCGHAYWPQHHNPSCPECADSIEDSINQFGYPSSLSPCRI